MRGTSRAEVPRQDGRVRIDATVAKERPVAARLLDEPGVACGHQDRLIRAGLREDTPERVCDERVAEELDAARARLVVLVPDAMP